MDQAHYDVLIIGAGVSGMAAGIRAAYFGKRVCILEKHAQPGGLNSFYQRGGRELDTGLHAMTNYVARDARSAPLNKLLRQLRIPYDELALCPQQHSEIRFPGVTLRFSNDFEMLAAEVRRNFPQEAEAFRRLAQYIRTYDSLDVGGQALSARAVLNAHLHTPLLVEMLLCPPLFYGSPTEDDLAFGAYAIMFRSIFLEGLARPEKGVRQIISVLLNKYQACHGELRLRTGVTRLHVAGGRVVGVELQDGGVLTADTILSSAGAIETRLLCSDCPSAEKAQLQGQAGRMTFMESISILSAQPRELGLDQAIIFFNSSEHFRYRAPPEPVDVASAVVCFPNNYQYRNPPAEGLVRVTNMANYAYWAQLPEDEYRARKLEWRRRSLAAVGAAMPDFTARIIFTDVFTPRTIHKFTGHLNGAVYGAPEKSSTGRTRLDNLYLCGTDQGLLGLVGAMLSGMMMVNEHVLKEKKQ